MTRHTRFASAAETASKSGSGAEGRRIASRPSSFAAASRKAVRKSATTPSRSKPILSMSVALVAVGGHRCKHGEQQRVRGERQAGFPNALHQYAGHARAGAGTYEIVR